MNTSGLESFGSKARASLLEDVGLQVDRVLAENSPARRSSPHQVEALERALASEGRDNLIERVAYTWFNRFIALRYMDARGYTSVGVVSPASGSQGGQGSVEPEVLSLAKQGNIDTSIVAPKVAYEIRDLLFGSSGHATPHEEAYRLLLLEYCRHWNRSTPFMFEPPEDFTELLAPPSLLATNSIRAQAVEALTPELCDEGVEVIGWLYQFYNASLKDEVYESFKKGVKAGAKEIPAATQLFTPDWIVRYLVQNSLGRLWLENHPESSLREHMDYYVDDPTPEEIEEMDELYGTTDLEVVVADEGEDAILKVSSPEEIKVLDPACGSGHMLTYAFDLLYRIYEEEGYAPSQIATLILENNLVGFEIDPRAAALASFALAMKARERQRRYFTKKGPHGLPTQPNIQVIEPLTFTSEELAWLGDPNLPKTKQDEFWLAFENADALGSLIQPNGELVEPLSARVDVLQKELGFGQAAIDGVHRSETLKRAQRVLEQSKMLSSRHHVVVANPPYLGAKSMNDPLKKFLGDAYPEGKRDLFAAFMLREMGLARKSGFAAAVTMQSWMFLSSFTALRNEVLEHASLVSMAHLGTRAFDSIGGEVVATTAFVISNAKAGQATTFLRLVDGAREEEKRLLLVDALRVGTNRHRVRPTAFAQVPDRVLSYWLPAKMLASYSRHPRLGSVAAGQPGLQTSNNTRFLRLWWEPSGEKFVEGSQSSEEASASGAKWFPHLKGGQFRKWHGNQEYAVNWENDGEEIKSYVSERYPYLKGNVDYVVKDRGNFFKELITYTSVTAGEFAARQGGPGAVFDVAGSAVLPRKEDFGVVLGFLNSSVAAAFLSAQNPTMNMNPGDLAATPLPLHRFSDEAEWFAELTRTLVGNARADWDTFETSWDFTTPPVQGLGSLRQAYKAHYQHSLETAAEQQRLEEDNNRKVAELYGLEGEVPIEVPLDRVSLTLNPHFRYGAGKTGEEYEELFMRDAAADLISYAVGSIFGRFSLDKPGFILMDQGSTLEDFYEEVPEPSFAPSKTGILPITAGDWFEDDLSNQVKRFVRTAFGEEHYEENLTWLEEALGVKQLEDYFPNRFWQDHLQRYKKRPIYWLFSSGRKKDSFNALIYLHRYTPDTVGEVLNEYVHALIDKQRVALESAEQAAEDESLPGRDRTRARREVRDLRLSLEELEKYEREVLHPLAGQRIALDLDDGVKVNYPKLYPALRKIPGL